MAYYHRCLGHFENITQLKKYDINLSKKVNNKISYVFCVVKKITQVKHTSRIRPERRSMNLVHSDIDMMKKTSRGLQFFITFLNNYIKRSKVEVINFKDEAFPTFLRYLKRNKREDCRYNRLRTD